MHNYFILFNINRLKLKYKESTVYNHLQHKKKKTVINYKGKKKANKQKEQLVKR